MTARKQLVALRRFFARHASTASRAPGRANPVSIRSAAIEIGVSDRSIRRWLSLSKRYHPNPASLGALVAWRRARPED